MRKLFKNFIFIIASIIVLPLIIIVKLEEHITRSEKLFQMSGQFLSLFPGFIGDTLRLGFYFFTLKKCSKDICICFGSLIPHRDTAIGKNSVIGAYSIIGRAEIGEGVLISSRVSILSGKHQHMPGVNENTFSEATIRYDKVKIGSNTWIGEGSIVLANIGKNCLVAAGSIVFKKIQPAVTVAGNPARVVAIRKQDSMKD